MTAVAVLLAAGQSTRFGAENKLLALFDGKPLVRHAADAIIEAGFDARVAVTAASEVSVHLPEFDVVAPAAGQGQQSDSLRAGIARVLTLGATQIVICLGDMPLVTPEMINAVRERSKSYGVSALTDGKRRMPPVALAVEQAEAFQSVRGDEGARGLLRALPAAACVIVPSATLFDVDNPTDLPTFGVRG